MRLGMFVNRIETEGSTYTTTRLAQAATELGHEVWYIGSDDFAYDPDESLRARSRRAPQGVDDPEAFVTALRSDACDQRRIVAEDLDVLMLRNDPAEDFLQRPWARSIGIIFGELAAQRGVLVVNDPTGLSRALNKLYFQQFPREIRPKTLVTRDPGEVHRFVEDHGGDTVLKPLQGSGGHGVFLVREHDRANINQMIESICRDGYLVVQEYLPAAEDGDLRILLMNGRPLEVDGHYAAFRRIRTSSDFRNNVTAGAEPAAAEVDDTVLRVAEMVRPRLLQDGMFLAGLDIAGDKLMEVNVFSPAGIVASSLLSGVDFATEVIGSLQGKLEHVDRYDMSFPNLHLSVL